MNQISRCIKINEFVFKIDFHFPSNVLVSGRELELLRTREHYLIIISQVCVINENSYVPVNIIWL